MDNVVDRPRDSHAATMTTPAAAEEAGASTGSASSLRADLRALAQNTETHTLVARFAAAQRDARTAQASLERLLVVCRPVAARIAHPYARSEADAADMAQEALIAVARFLPDLRQPDAFPRWLAAVAHNACRQWLRRERRHRQNLLSLDADAGDPGGAAMWALGDVEDPAARSDFDQAAGRDVLATLLRTLPPKERELVRRRYLDDQPMLEVARRMEISAKAAESLAYRALRRLRLVATQCGDEWEELALWCPHCGARRLLARLTPGNGPQWPLHVRAVCPACRLTSYDMGLPPDRHASLEAALMDGLAGLGTETQDVVRAQDPRCVGCGTAVRRVAGDPPGRVAWRCPRCSLGGIGGVECVAATLPAWRAFRLATPRLRFGPVTEATRGGERQALLAAWDQETGKRATVSVATSTMAVRAIELPA